MRHPLSLTLLAFWCLWYVCITLTNVADWLSQRYNVQSMARWGSGNLHSVHAAVASVSFAPWVGNTLFLGVIAIEAMGACLFAHALAAAAGLRVLPIFHDPLSWAIGWGIAVWGLFILADSVFRTYEFTPLHFTILCAHLLTALLLGVHPPF